MTRIPSQTLTPEIFCRESALLLRKLKSARAVLQREQGVWFIFGARNGGSTSLGKVDSALVNAMLQENLLFRQAGDMLVASLNEKTPSFNEGETPLMRLYLRKDAHGHSAINSMQFAAGEKLRADYERAQMERRVTASWDQHGSSGGRYHQSSDNQLANLADGAIAARQRLHAACVAVGPELTA